MHTRNCLEKNHVYVLIFQISKGKVSTYGHLAKALRKPNASRAIGKILNCNPYPIIISFHVIGLFMPMVLLVVITRDIIKRLIFYPLKVL